METVKYKRILLKLSGEALMGASHNMFDKPNIDSVTAQIMQIHKLGIKIGIVVGGGNIFRGSNGVDLGFERVNADYIGMLATIMNGIALRDFLSNVGIKAKIYSALPVANIINGYNRDSMLKNLEDGYIIIFVAGTGNPCFSTDSGAALRAVEMNADLLIKATKVDGVYDSDPRENLTATKHHKISFNDAIAQNLKVMDMAAFDLCRANKINVEVCNIFHPNSLRNSVEGSGQGTLIYA